MKSKIKIFWVVGMLMSLVSCGKESKNEQAESAEQKEVEVVVQEVKARRVIVYEEVVGTVRPKLEATVSAKIAGRILEMKVVPGQKIEAGQEIAVLDAGELEAARNRAVAALEQAEREWKRQKELMVSNATSKAMFDQAESAYRMSAAGLAEVSATLEHASLKAPFGGTVARKLADVGDLAIPGKGIIQLEAPEDLRLETAVPESLAGGLKLGDTIPVVIESLQLEVNGKVSELSPSAEASTRTFMVMLDLPKSAGLRPGLFGRARIPRGEREKILIASASVRRGGQMESVFVVQDGKALMKLVRTTARDGDEREVLAGISPGMRLVVDPPAEMREGDRVKEVGGGGLEKSGN